MKRILFIIVWFGLPGALLLGLFMLGQSFHGTGNPWDMENIEVWNYYSNNGVTTKGTQSTWYGEQREISRHNAKQQVERDMRFGNIPLYFIAHKGQENEKATFGYTLNRDFPLHNRYHSALQGDNDGFIGPFVFVGPPTVDSPTYANVSYTTATLGGNISCTNNAKVTMRGVFWAVGNAYIFDSVYETGEWDTGEFSIDVTGLPSGFRIDFHAFAVNSAGYGYSEDRSFYTLMVKAPSLTIGPVSDITYTTAVGSGCVTDGGGMSVTARGLCWNTSPNPTTANGHTIDGIGVGEFTGSITGLTPGTLYYVRAYAVNHVGTGYSEQRSFTTTVSTVPIVATDTITDITPTNAAYGGVVSADGGSPVTDRGVCWSRNENPTTADHHTHDGTGTGSFSGTLTGLIPGVDYYLRAYATNSQGTAYGNPVTFTTCTRPRINVNRTRFNYGAVVGGASTGPQDLVISNSGGWHLKWQVLTTAPWILVDKGEGTDTGVVKVRVSHAGLPVGEYEKSVTVFATGAVINMRTVYIYLSVHSAADTAVPFGVYATPADGALVSSNVPFTGWVLDDLGVENVRIYRETAAGLAYIGDAVLVEGARPDVENAFPDYPLNYKAGWGYMMLTNFLPGGNGQFTIHAVAQDREGNKVTLGTKRITVDNASAVKPFGTIDTPAQGGIASGDKYVNFGWALTQRPNTIPFNGSTIHVWVDGKPLGNPIYNRYRKDIAALFPGYNNSNGAVGYLVLDTTIYADGVHTIAWSVTDDAGNTDGIGSRYFQVLNVSDDASRQVSPMARPGTFDIMDIEDLPLSSSPIALIRGYESGGQGETPMETVHPDGEGMIYVGITEMERIKMNLGGGCHGYLMVDGQLRPLPVGSTLDVETGIFYWQPGPGFLGEYRFVFIQKEPDGPLTRRIIHIEIQP